MVSKKNLYLVCACFLLALPISAQHNNFKNFSIQDGLTNSSIYKIYQDSRGIIWIGSNGAGVIRFEGNEFTSFTTNDGLSGNSVRSIIEDRQGNLWFGTDGGLNRFDGISISVFKESEDLGDNQVTCLLEDREGHIWAGYRNSGLVRIRSLEGDSLVTEKYHTGNGLSSDFVLSLYEDNSGKIWVGTYGYGICILSPGDSVVNIEHLVPGINIPGARISCIEEDQEGNIWVGSIENGAFCISESADSPSVKSLETDVKKKGLTIWSILSDSRGNLWFGTGDKGVMKWNGSRLSVFSDTIGMPGNQVYDCMEDYEGNIWFSTFGEGICMYGGDHLSHFSEYDGISDNLVSGIEQDRNGFLWMSTLGGAINAMDPGSDIPEFYTYGENIGLTDKVVNDIEIGRGGAFWAATPNGIAKLEGNKFVYLTENNNLVNNFVNCLQLDEQRNLLWCGTRGGISIFNGTGFLNITELSDEGLINNEVQHIIQDTEGNIWAATLGGLVKFYEGKMTDYDEEEGLFHKKLLTLAEDGKGNIWMGTFGGGLFMLDIRSDSMPISQMADDEILSSDNIYSLIFQNDSTLLIGTEKGMDYVSVDENYSIEVLKSYDHTDGFYGIPSQNAVYRSRNDNFWFGTGAGLTRFNPTAENISLKSPYLHMTDILLFFEHIDWGERVDSVQPWYHIPYEMELSHADNNLTFKFQAISNRNPEKVTYQYFLEGTDKDFTPPTTNNEINYSGLKPGNYTLQVIATNVDNVQSETLIFPIVIKPPFWQTIWFYAIVILLLLFGIFIFIKYRERQLILKNRELEQKVLERTAKISRQKSLIEEKNKNLETANIEIKEQKNVIENKNKDITDSIKYAQRIQSALLPSYDLLKESFPDSFILFKPRDIVSGDYYWVKKLEDEMIVVAADCTGHGVPGAFMSMLGISYLNEIVAKDRITEPSGILNKLRDIVISALKQGDTGSETRDGMDLALCKINNDKKLLWYAGAYNPLWLIRNGELLDYRGDRMPIAIYEKMNDFTTQTIELQKEDTIYMFSDGFADQFGGEEGKKFKSKKFKELLLSNQNMTMEDQKELLDKTIHDWRGEIEQVDDILVVGLRIT